MATYRFCVLTSAHAGRVNELARWYDEVHIPDCLSLPGFVAAERMEVLDAKGPADPSWDFLTTYTIETEDLDGTMAMLMDAMRSGRFKGSDAMNGTKALRVIAKSLA